LYQPTFNFSLLPLPTRRSSDLSDLQNAHVFVSVLGSGIRESVVNKLASHRATLQAELARNVTMKYTPHLIFHLDDSIERGARVIEILQEIEMPRGDDK